MGAHKSTIRSPIECTNRTTYRNSNIHSIDYTINQSNFDSHVGAYLTTLFCSNMGSDESTYRSSVKCTNESANRNTFISTIGYTINKSDYDSNMDTDKPTH